VIANKLSPCLYTLSLGHWLLYAHTEGSRWIYSVAGWYWKAVGAPGRLEEVASAAMLVKTCFAVDAVDVGRKKEYTRSPTKVSKISRTISMAEVLGLALEYENLRQFVTLEVQAQIDSV
jgi:hypothetical protein